MSKYKFKIIAYWAVCILSVFETTNTAYCQCDSSSCLTDEIKLNTGIDQITMQALPSSTIGNTVQDPGWLLVSAPSSSGPVNLGSPAFVISTIPSWDDMRPASNPPSKYISAFPIQRANETTPAHIPYVFEKKICVCDSDVLITISDSFHVDNQLTLKIIGPGLAPGGVILSEYRTTNVGAFLIPPEDDGVVSGIPLQANSTYFLHAELYNDNSGSPMGLNISGSIMADKPFLSDPSCCNNGSFISGFKFLDDNCNGIQDAGEISGQGFTILLKDNLGTVLQTATTDVSGYYFFPISTPGTYTVEEQNPLPTGFSQSFPPGGIGHTISVGANVIHSNVNFGNCCVDCQLFKQNANQINFSFSTNGKEVTIYPSGLTPNETYSVDINGNGQYEIQQLNSSANATYTFPHYGFYQLRIKVESTQCGYPCIVYLTDTVQLEESCISSNCYDQIQVDIFCNVVDVCMYEDDLILAGDLVFGQTGIASWDGSSFQWFNNFGFANLVLEVEPYNGNLYALSQRLQPFDVQLHKWNGIFWQLEHSEAVGNNYNTGTNGSYDHNELVQTSTGLYAAFYQDNSVLSTSSHKVYRLNGSSKTLLPDPIDPIGTLAQYYLVGEMDGQFPIIRADFNVSGGSSPIKSYLYYWDLTQWQKLTPNDFWYENHSGTRDFGDGVAEVKGMDTNHDGMDDYFVCVGEFEYIQDQVASPVPGTQFIAAYNALTQSWESVGGGATLGGGGYVWSGILEVDIIDGAIFVAGEVGEMNGVSCQSNAWYDGTVWRDLNREGIAFYRTMVTSQDSQGFCEVYFAGECKVAKTVSCCLFEDLNLTQTETSSKVYRTNGRITSSSTLTGTADIVYIAGQGTTLLPTFNVVTPGVVQVQTGGCDDCCALDPLTDLDFLQPFVGNPNNSISQAEWNGDCIYVVSNYCIRSDGATSYYDCLGNLICESFQVGTTCDPAFSPTNFVLLQACN